MDESRYYHRASAKRWLQAQGHIDSMLSRGLNLSTLWQMDILEVAEEMGYHFCKPVSVREGGVCEVMGLGRRAWSQGVLGSSLGSS
jgi:hypothetical protein